MRHHQARAVQ